MTQRVHLYLNVYTMSVPKNTDKGGNFEVILGPRNFRKEHSADLLT